MVEGGDNKMWTFKFQGIDENGKIVDYATEQAKKKLEASLKQTGAK